MRNLIPISLQGSYRQALRLKRYSREMFSYLFCFLYIVFHGGVDISTRKQDMKYLLFHLTPDMLQQIYCHTVTNLSPYTISGNYRNFSVCSKNSLEITAGAGCFSNMGYRSKQFVLFSQSLPPVSPCIFSLWILSLTSIIRYRDSIFLTCSKSSFSKMLVR